jgi:hypothetical protein
MASSCELSPSDLKVKTKVDLSTTDLQDLTYIILLCSTTKEALVLFLQSLSLISEKPKLHLICINNDKDYLYAIFLK